MKKQAILSLLIWTGLLLGIPAEAQARYVLPKPDPKYLEGYDTLYADLNQDGHIERVGLVPVRVPLNDEYDCYAYEIIVMNDKGKVIWRSDYSILDGGSVERFGYCLLCDLDGDGCKELAFGAGRWLQESNSDDIEPELYPYRIFTWKNNAFRGYHRTGYGNKPYSHIRKGNDGVYRINEPISSDGSNNGLYFLHCKNGHLLGAVVVKEYDTSISAPDLDSDLPDDVEVAIRGNYVVYYKIARLVPSDGGLKIVEYSKF